MMLIHLLKSVFNSNPGLANIAYKPNSPSNSFFFLINKFVLDHRHTYSFAYCLWLLLSNDDRGEQLGQTPDTI